MTDHASETELEALRAVAHAAQELLSANIAEDVEGSALLNGALIAWHQTRVMQAVTLAELPDDAPRPHDWETWRAYVTRARAEAVADERAAIAKWLRHRWPVGMMARAAAFAIAQLLEQGLDLGERQEMH